jgi:non-specific serine/threonine protein kinase
LPILRHHHQLACLRRLRIEQENVRAALEWALTSSALAEKGVELAGALFWFWTKRGLYEEGQLWLEQALAVVHAARGLRARALIGLAHMHTFRGRHVEVGALATEALSLGREDGDAWVVSFALSIQGLAAFELGDHKQAAALAVAARDAANAGGDEDVQHAHALLILGNIAVLNGDHDRAQQLYDESIERCRRAGETWGLSVLLSVAAGLRIVRQDFDQARALASEAMSLCQEFEDPRGIAWSLDVFAGLLAAGGYADARRQLDAAHADAAARLWGASDGLLASVGGSLVPTIGWIRDRYIEPVKTSLGGEAFETARAEGRAMPVVQAIALARQQTLLRG